MNKVLLSLLLFSFCANAEVHKEARLCSDSGQMCFYWWPKLPKIEGWKQDIGNSYHYRANTQAPEGFNFSNAGAVIYANAEFREAEKDKRSLDDFIEYSQNQFISNAPSELDIRNTKNIRSKGGHSFLSFSFFPSGEGNWEQVSYAEDKDSDGNRYFIIVVLSSRSKEAYDKNIGTYYQFIAEYK